MIIRYMGHAFFTLSLENGLNIAMDPYGDFYQYPERSVAADICLISHHHGDHDGISSLASKPAAVIDTAGEHRPADGVRVTGIATCHDDKGGSQRGSNVFFIVEAEGLRIGHAGDLGHRLSDEQVKRIGALDILLLPVGGYYTIDARAAADTVKALKPRCAVPMHYRTKFDPDMPIAPVDDFLALMGQSPAPMPLIRATKADMSERPALMLMDIAEA